MHQVMRDYDVDSFFDEAFSGAGQPRPHYQPVTDWFERFDPDEIRRLSRQLDGKFRRQGVTFVPSTSDGRAEDTWPMDLFPRIISSAEWSMVEAGLIQRVTALNLFLEDIYSGPQSIIKDGIVPEWLVTSSTGFVRQGLNLKMPKAARCSVAGIDVVRDDAGVYRVLEDNVRNPSGISYVLENRAAMTRLMPSLFPEEVVRSVDHYGQSLFRSLAAIAPAAASDNPTVVVLTPGMYNSAYFEHTFLARKMGVELVEGRDLVVQDETVFMRTTHGLARVDVIYRRIDDEFLDPVTMNPDSALGVPGLLSAIRAETVTVANAIGNGVADDKAVYPFVPNMIAYYLNQEPILPNVETHLLWDEDQREAALDRLEELVVKPVAESGGYGIVIGSRATEEELDLAEKNIRANPRNWIAQELVQLSRVPSWAGDEFAGRHVDLRPFVLTGENVEVIPGGLTRVAMRENSLIVNSSQGGGSKDTWVLVDDANSNFVQQNLAANSKSVGEI